MKFRSLPASLVALAFVVLASGISGGCRSRPPGRIMDSAAGAEATPALAEALANFGAGVLRSSLGETNAALENLRRAESLAPENVRVSFHLAMQYANRGQPDEALQTMAAAVVRHPDSPEACWLQSRVAQAVQRPELALQALERAIALAPTQSAGYLNLAIFHAGRQEDDRALAVLEDALPRVDDPLPLLRILGDSYAARLQLAVDANDAQARQNLNRAIECYRQAALQPPDELWDDYQSKLGNLYLADTQCKPAIEIFSELVRRQPDDLEARKKLALSFMCADRSDEAAAEWQGIIARDPGNAEAQYFLGQLQSREGADDKAIAAYRAAIKAEPENPRSFEKLALLLADGDLPQAIAVLEDGLRRAPDSLELQDLLARLYLRAGRGEDALKIFRSLQSNIEKRASPKMLSYSFWLGYAAAAQQSGRRQEAVALYEKALAVNPKLLEAYIRLASIHVAHGANQEADAVMRRALAALPDNAEALYFSGIIASQSGDYARACEAFARAAELARAAGVPPKFMDADFYFYYGVAREREKSLAQAEELFRQALQIDPDHADAANYLAYMWAERGINLEQALLHVQHAVELHPENGAYMDTLGWVYFKLGRLDEAADEIHNALQVTPGDPTVMEHYGDILERRGYLSAARSWWVKSWQAKPGNPELRRKLERSGGLPSVPPVTNAPAASSPDAP